MTETSKVEQVKKEFLAALDKDGMGHTFNWMSGWFDRVAEAQVEDELNRSLGEHAKDPTARGLWAMDQMMPLATSASNPSSLPSANEFRLARLAALAEVVENMYTGPEAGFGSRMHRRETWKEWQAANEAKASKA